MAGCLVVFVAACGEALPRPDHITAPETVGVVTSFDEIECGLGRFHLDTGATVEVRDPDCQGVTDTREMFTGASGSPRPQPGEPWENGPLLLFGSDDEGAWYAMAGGGEGCYQVYGDNAYLEGDFLQFSSGLRLPVAAAFEMNRDRTETFLFHSSDTICLDRTGTAVSAFVVWGT
jgi:hypothetical protein